MFTGIVQSVAKVFSVKVENNLAKVVIEVAQEFANELSLGASIAINGVCLTVVNYQQVGQGKCHINFDVIDETLRVSNLGFLSANDAVNYERSLKVGDEIGGHYVSGHVHAQAKLVHIKQSSENTCLQFKLAGESSSNFHQYLFEKGFIAINGASLTLGKVNDGEFEVHLIPETLSRTNLRQLKLMGIANIEFDQQTITIVKTIKRMKLPN